MGIESIMKNSKDKIGKGYLGDFQEVSEKIDSIAKKLAAEIGKYRPLDLLHRAFWTSVANHIRGMRGNTSERDQYLSTQTLEFIQNYLISLPSAVKEYSSLEDDGWGEIENLVTEFNHQMIFFFILRSKYLQEHSEKYDSKGDELLTLDVMHWWRIRGNSYHVHQIQHVRELLLPQKTFFETVFDYSVESFLNDLEKIQYSLTYGFGDVIESTYSLYEKIENATKNENNIGEFPSKEKAKEIIDQAFGLGLCDVGKITNMPNALLDKLSWQAGEDKDFWSKGDYAGWPLRVTPLRKRPFIKVEGNYYCFSLLNLFDNIYRVIESLILGTIPERREDWNIIRRNVSEQISIDYLSSMLPGAEIYSPVYYGKLGFRAETDGIIIYDDVLIIVEVKSGALDKGSPLLDFEKHQKKMLELIQNPATQAKNFKEHLISNEEIKLFDGNRRKSSVLTKINASVFRKIYQCTISVDSMTHMTARAQKLSPLGIKVVSSANWSISLDDLRVYSDIFQSPFQFLHFLEQRKLAQESELIDFNDELDHLGLYLKMNNYSLYAKELMEDEKHDYIIWDTFTQEIDDYFNKLYAEKDITYDKPNQEMPDKLGEIIFLLEEQRKVGRVRAASFLLDGDEDYRKTLEYGISHTIKRQADVGRLNPFYIGGEMCIACFCIQPKIKLPSQSWREDYVRYRLLNSGHEEALALTLEFNKRMRLVDVEFDFISIGKRTILELERIRSWGERLKNTLSTSHFPVQKQ